MTSPTRTISLLFAIMLTGCTSPALKVKDISFASSNLNGALTGQTVAMRTEYREGKNMCHVIREKDRLHRALLEFGGKHVVWEDRKAGDVVITSRWVCSGNANKHNHSQGLTDTAGAVASLFTLGLLPTVTNRGYLSLDVTIERGKQKVFAGSYREDRDVSGNAFTDANESFAQDYGHTSDVLIAKFLEELDRDGALDK